MKINRRILKIKSKFYYYTLVFFGAVSVLSLTRCTNAVSGDNSQHVKDSIAQAKAIQDSVAKADSTALAEIEKARQDSIARADSIAKAAKKPRPNPYKPTGPVCKYGIIYKNQ